MSETGEVVSKGLSGIEGIDAILGVNVVPIRFTASPRRIQEDVLKDYFRMPKGAKR